MSRNGMLRRSAEVCLANICFSFDRPPEKAEKRSAKQFSFSSSINTSVTK